MKPLISIIIPCYNDAQFIEQSVDSALSQTYLNKEVIVIDDGSDEKTKKVLKSLEHKITKLIIQENQGQSRARNVGILASKGEYIFVLDSDDFIESTLCEKAIDVFFKHNDVKIATCYAKIILENGGNYISKTNGGSVIDFAYGNHALGGASMFKKIDWESCGGYDEKMRLGFEDWEFFIRLLKNEGRAVVIPEVLYNYNKRLNSTTAIANKNTYQILEYMLIKNRELYINDFDNFVRNMISRLINLENQKQKVYKKKDYLLGHFLLKPLRFLKSILR